jgi:1-acyl-sn-glycerol-3-phosphate acyltransferase
VVEDDSIEARVRRLELPFDALGVDPYGISRSHLTWAFTALGLLYRRYFRVRTVGAAHVPPRGRGILVGNHSGGIAVDGAMVLASVFLELDPPRLAHGMAEKFLGRLPFSSVWTARTGQLTGLPEQAARLLEDDRLLLVFPEGARGTAKLYPQRHSLVEFGTGFLRLALRHQAPIVPFAFLGGGEAIPTVLNLYRLGQLFGVPYLPVTPWLLPLPLPVRCEIRYGEPLFFEGTGSEDDEVVNGYVDQVKRSIAELMR